jgi:ABC-type antimicrobial peptide transport system permease subunit
MNIRAFLHSKLARGVLSGFAGFAAYGGWAYFINLQHGTQAGLKAGLTQGTYSFFLTLVLALVMESLFHLYREPRTQFWFTFMLTCCLLYFSSWGINALSGTPEILLTILPGSIIGTIYTFAYTLTLSKLQAAKAV